MGDIKTVLTDEHIQEIIDSMPRYDECGRKKSYGHVNLGELSRAIERTVLAASEQAAPAAVKKELFNCSITCQAARQDGILCPNDRCDFEDGIRIPATNKASQPLPDVAAEREADDAKIGRFLMRIATENDPSAWPRLHKINWCGYAVTNESSGYKHWTLREALIEFIATLQPEAGDKP